MVPICTCELLCKYCRRACYFESVKRINDRSNPFLIRCELCIRAFDVYTFEMHSRGACVYANKRITVSGAVEMDFMCCTLQSQVARTTENNLHNVRRVMRDAWANQMFCGHINASAFRVDSYRWMSACIALKFNFRCSRCIHVRTVVRTVAQMRTNQLYS